MIDILWLFVYIGHWTLSTVQYINQYYKRESPT